MTETLAGLVYSVVSLHLVSSDRVLPVRFFDHTFPQFFEGKSSALVSNPSTS